MVNIEIRNNNNIITLIGEGKIPLQSSQGMIHFSPNELLCAAVGSCIGRALVIYLAHNRIDTRDFESIAIDFIDNKLIIHIQHPKDITQEVLNDVKNVIFKCEMVKLLQPAIITEIKYRENNTSSNVLKSKRSKPCCGG